MSQLSYTALVDGDQPLAAGFNSRFLLAINLINSGLESDNLANSAVTAAKIASGAVTGPKIAMGSDAQGDILYRNATEYTRLGAGTSGQFLKTNGTGANPSWGDAAAIIPRSSFRNLAVSRTNATTCAITADEIIVQDSSNVSVRATSVSVSPAITTSGANGLDTGAEAANTIYYLWVIRKSSDGTVAGLLSVSSTAPTMPSGYDQKALVSAVGNDNSSNFIPFSQTGKRYNFTTWATMGSGSVGSSWTSIDLTPANMTTNAGFVPSALSTYCYGSFYAQGIDISNVNTGTTTVGTNQPNRYSTTQTASNECRRWEFDIITADTLYWMSSDADSTVYLHGFEINKLG